MRKGVDLKTYRAWAHMKGRCDNLNDSHYPRYGGRGISYDLRWRSYENFLSDMGEAPEYLTLERRDNNKGYCKENCRWASWEDQAKNKSLYKTNRSGIAGLHFCATQRVWVARAHLDGYRWQLYKGPDFFEACCARKSWEART